MTHNAKHSPVSRLQECPTPTTPKKSPFDGLPDSVVIKILSNLNSNQIVRCSRVSRRFYFLAWEPELWNRIELTNHPDGRLIDADLALKTIIRLLSRNSNKHNNLDSVDLTGCQRLTDRGLAILARRCPNLTRLEVQQCPNITNGGLMDLLTKCPLVDHLDVTGRRILRAFKSWDMSSKRNSIPSWSFKVTKKWVQMQFRCSAFSNLSPRKLLVM